MWLLGWILQHPKISRCFILCGLVRECSVSQTCTKHSACVFVWSCLCVGVQSEREKLHCDLSLCNLVSRADFLLASSKPFPQNSWDQFKKINVELLHSSLHMCCYNSVTFDAFWYKALPEFIPPPPLWVCHGNVYGLLFFFLYNGGGVSEGGSIWGDEGLGGRLATGRHLSPRLASAHCCQPSSNQQPSMCLAAEGVSNQPLAPS